MKRIRSAAICLVLIAALALSTASGRGAAGAFKVFAAVAKVAVVALYVAATIVQISRAVELRREPNSEVIVCRAPAQTRIKVLSYSADKRWVQVRLPDGRVGWVRARELPAPTKR